MAPSVTRYPWDIEDTAFGDASDDDIEVQHFVSGDEDDEDDERQYIVIDDDNEDEDIVGSPRPTVEEPFPLVIELPYHRIETSSVIRTGDTVELEDRTGRVADHTLSGDFLRIVGIFEDLDTGEVSLKGYRLRRCTYLRPLFDAKFNELFMLIEASEDDHRPLLDQGLQTVPVTEVLQKRRCEFTHVDYAAYGCRDANRYTMMPAGLKTSDDIRTWIFHNGTLICRWMYTVVFDHNSVSYSGEVRKLYRRESDDKSRTATPTPPATPMHASPSSSASSATLSAASSSSSSSSSHRSSHMAMKRQPSVELIETSPIKRGCHTKPASYTFADSYCGIGGASEGARQAGFIVKWALEKDETAMYGYAKNFPHTEHLFMDARDFKAIAYRCEHGVDVLHISCPCCYWSEAHTNAGKNDQENMELLLTVGPFLEAVKPRYATLEQAPGLLKLKKHRMWFRKLINEITSRKYNVRWRVTDQSEYGLPQRRRRLIFLCAKEGLPLPAFPKPAHGPKGSGLPDWVTVGDALKGLREDPYDIYHIPEKERPLARPLDPVDPHTILAKCITTSGGENVHPSGIRRYTPRETAKLQGFPSDYLFNGSRGQATKQAGNAWAPVASMKYFQVIAQLLEAWDLGFIDPEDEVDDLFDYLENKNIRIPSSSRYLSKLTKTVVSKKKHPLWGSTYKVDAAPRTLRAAPLSLPTRKQRRVLEEFEVAGDDVIVLD